MYLPRIIYRVIAPNLEINPMKEQSTAVEDTNHSLYLTNYDAFAWA